MEIYVVRRWGVYCQGVVGVFSTPDIAKDAVVVAKAEEPDDYHEFSITPLKLDRASTLSNEGRPAPEDFI